MNTETKTIDAISPEKEVCKIKGYRLGTITKMDISTNRIWVDYEDNPFNNAVLARLGTPWICSEEL
ncbi:MAG: hypothetical protein MJE63_22815, partial [Proteobacteria bacterium]|nr:hypothetical protein [Pseudomonadota bacterium]